MQKFKENPSVENIIYISIFSILNKNLKRFCVFIFSCFALFLSAVAQDDFKIENGEDYFELSFELVNDLVVIPVEINGVELSFLLDSGVNNTILFSIGEEDSLQLRNLETIYLRGFGGVEPVKAVKSSGNMVRIGESVNKNLIFYMVYDNPVDLSNRLGIPIHGIIGNDLFRDFIIELNYIRSKLKAYRPDSYAFKKCRKCVDLDLHFYKNKPYIKVNGIIEKNLVPLDLLVDSGSGDALWIFENKDEGITIPEKCFEDFLGFGIGGSVYGQRSRIKSLDLGNLTLDGVTASFPDTLYLKNIVTFQSRNGSMGAQILRRFHVTFDYPGKKLRLKPNKNFREPFEYDMSGVVVAHDGFTVIKDLMRNPLPLREDDPNQTAAGNLVYKSTYNIKYALKPLYKIVELRPDSPAEKAGLRNGDVLIKINGKNAYNLSLSRIASILSSSDGKKIRLIVEREGVQRKFTFALKRIL